MTGTILPMILPTLTCALEQAQAKLQESSTLLSADVSLPDAMDRASAESDRNFALLIRERNKKMLDDVLQAFARIEAGEYGICMECGEDIAPARLRAQPTAAFCTHCQSYADEQRVRGFEAAGRPL